MQESFVSSRERLGSAPERSTQDAFLAYVVNQYFARFQAGFQRTDHGGGVIGNAIQLGVQAQKM